MKNAFVGVSSWDGVQKINLNYYETSSNLSTSETYAFLSSPNVDELTDEQIASIAWTQDTPIKQWYLLTSEGHTTALYFTNNYTQTKSNGPVFIHLDVTAKYKSVYPNLERAYSVHRFLE